MILKWKEKSGAWRLTDGITDVTNHGWCELPVAQSYADEWSGMDTPLFFPMGPAHDPANREIFPPKGDSPRVGLYLVLMIRGRRDHWFMTTVQQAFLLSDDGKTIENLLR